MADSATLVGLLDKADNVFALAGDIGVALVREQSYRSDNPPPAQADWRQRQNWLIEAGSNLDQLQTSLRELQDAIQRPPGGFEDVAEQLREATKLALHCYQDGKVEIVRILGTWFLFHEVSEAGRKIVNEMCWAVRREGLAAILREPMSVPRQGDGAGNERCDRERANPADGLTIVAAHASGCDAVSTQGEGGGQGEAASRAIEESPSAETAVQVSDGNAGEAWGATKPFGPGEDQPLVSLLGIYTNGVADDRIKRAGAVLRDKSLTANLKLTEIHKALPIPPTATASQLGSALGVTAAAVKKTEWWKVNRKGRQSEAVNERHERMLERGKCWEEGGAVDG